VKNYVINKITEVSVVLSVRVVFSHDTSVRALR